MNSESFEAFDAKGNSYLLISFTNGSNGPVIPFDRIGNIHTDDGHNVQYLPPRKYRILNCDDDITVDVTSEADNAP